jgi:hypothetical protein
MTFFDGSENRKEGVNEGTKAKASLQLRAIEFMKNYSKSATLEIYAELLCWDLHTTKRTALDSYILPMLRHGYIINVDDNKYSFVGNGKENKKIKKGNVDFTDKLKDETETQFLNRIKKRENRETDKKEV